VADERIVDTFINEQELARKIALALRKWEERLPRAAQRSSEARHEPNFGRLVAKLCDRRTQEDEFREFYLDQSDRRPGCPQAYLIPGEEGQCHESLVERLIHRAERLMAGNELQRKAGRQKVVPWQFGGDALQRTRRLLYSVVEEMGGSRTNGERPGRSTRQPNLEEVLRELPNAYLAIRHDVHAARWDESTAETMASYFGQWGALSSDASRTPVFIFLAVIFRRSNAGGGIVPRLRAVLDQRQRKRIAGELQEVASRATIPCLALAELPPITREDVLEWFALHHVHASEEKRLTAVDQLFDGGRVTRKAMWEIEAFCATELQAYKRERGHDERWNWNRRDEGEAIFGRRGTNIEAQSATADV
jgi:hypothetical protein